MPTSKEQALADAEVRDSPKLTEFCAKVDTAIAEATGTGRQITVQTGGTPRHVVERALEIYRTLGWTCEYENAQRDGDFVRLT